MPPRDILAALILIVVWGANFVVMKLGLEEFPPLLLGGLRFVFVAFPAILFVPPPAIHWRHVLLYGATICVGQFMLLFLGLWLGMPAGLASIVMQLQAFMTVGIAAIVLRETLQAQHLWGMLLAVVGLLMLYPWSEGAAPVPLVGLLLTLMGAFSWAVGNVALKCAGQVRMLSLVVWGSLVAPLPFGLLSLLFEGRENIMYSLAHVSLQGVLVIAYLSILATLVGYVLWGQLLARHPMARVAPLSLLIPIVGLLCASVFLGEHLVLLQWLGGLVILVGLAVNLFGWRWLQPGFLKKL
ncbi:EamA family transporter [Castellaniella sp.]|uniref:EamA family transporter n=1 Tax=Castellaniella sp. TaxID=1955812 RepID=UPI00355FEC04